MITQKEFKIDSYKDLTFRVGKIDAIQMLAFRTTMDFTNIESTESTYKFVFEHLEVNVGNKWIPVKEKDINVYYPDGLDNNLNAMNELLAYFLNNVVKPLFMKSNESNQ